MRKRRRSSAVCFFRNHGDRLWRGGRPYHQGDHRPRRDPHLRLSSMRPAPGHVLSRGLAGVQVGAIATRHQLLITDPIPGVEPHQPITRVMDCNVYIRPADGGLLLGGYESDPLQIDMANVPAGFRIDDLPLDLAVLQPPHEPGGLISFRFPRHYRKGTSRRPANHDCRWRAYCRPAARPSRLLRGRRMLRGWIIDRADYRGSAGRLDCVRRTADGSIAALPGAFRGSNHGRGRAPRGCRRQYAFHYWAKPSSRGCLVPVPEISG